MNRTFAAAAALSLTMFSLPAYAEDEAPTPITVTGIAAPLKAGQAFSRPTVLTALYASYGALQAYDVYSTRQALGRGAREANPLMQNVAGNTGAFVAMKAGVAVATIAAAERLWKTNKPAAIGVMIAGNSVAAIVAARNARTLGQLR
jgi:ABC-type Fe3+ transport system substrate-binding protein